MLYVIGLGLSDEKDITVKGLEVSDSSAGRAVPSLC
jgi:diphthamide biosynthesis methyltransferase